MYCHKCRANVSNDSLYCHQCGANLLSGVIGDTENELTRNIKIDNFDLSAGEQFGGRYKIIEELGRGGMGRVYKAEDRVLGTVVSLKTIRPEYLSDKRMIERFKKEILLAREITNENVVRIHDFGEERGIKFITMNYIEGRSLKEIINDEGPLTFERILSIAKDACKGLIAVHKKGIIHRDLKPQNIMIGNDDHVYLTDFGLAKSTGGTNVSQTGIAIGTPQYIAPEQWKGEEADHRSDIYTFGIVLYEMVTGESLFTADTDLGYLQKHLNEKPVIPESIKDELPLYFRKIILKCLEKERNLRYQSAEEVLNGLEEGIFISTPVLARIKHLRFRQIKFSPAVIVVFIFIALLLLKLFTPGTMETDRIKRRSVAILSFKNLSGLKKLDHLSNSLSELLITDLGQSKFIKVMPEAKLFKILNETDYMKSNNLNSAIIEEINEKGNINYLIYGSFVKSGEFLRITAKLLDLKTGELVDTSSADTEPDRIFPAVDRLTRELKRSFNLTDNEIFEDIDTNIENITTSSQEALKYYIEGKRHFNLANYEKSLTFLKKAVKTDPEFAMGYRQIAWAYAYLYDWDKRKEYFEKTIKHVDKLSEKEKLKILGDYYAEDSNTLPKAIESYNKILKIYPNDTEINFQLGLIYRMLERFEEAIKRQKVVLKEDRSNINALDELLVSLGSLGKFEEIEKLIKESETNIPDIHKSAILEQKYRLYIETGKYDLASLIIDELNSLKSDQKIKYSKWKIYISKGEYKFAEDEFNNLQNNKFVNYKNINIKDKLYLHLIKGSFKKAIKILKNEISRPSIYVTDKIQNLFYLFNFYLRTGNITLMDKEIGKIRIEHVTDEKSFINRWKFYKALLYVNTGKIKEAELVLDELKKNYKNCLFKNSNLRDLHYLTGKIKEKNGNIGDAISHYNKVISLLFYPYGGDYSYNFHTFFYFEIAKLFYTSGQMNNAEEWLLKILNLNTGQNYFGDLYARSFYYLGKIYQQKGWTGKAIESYDKFYSLWKDGDHEFVSDYLNDIREQLNKLQQ